MLKVVCLLRERGSDNAMEEEIRLLVAVDMGSEDNRRECHFEIIVGLPGCHDLMNGRRARQQIPAARQEQ